MLALHKRVRWATTEATVHLGPKYMGFYGAMSGKKIDAVVLSFLEDANAYVVRDTASDELYIVTRSMIKKLSSPLEEVKKQQVCAQASHIPRFRFRYRIGSKVPFTIGAETYDQVGNLLTGEEVEATVLYHIYDGGKRWYVLQLDPPHYDTSDPHNWWTGFDIRSEENVK
jgi:hypothetical protein